MGERKFEVVKGRSHGGKFNGMVGYAVQFASNQVCLKFDGIKINDRTNTGGYWFIKDNVREIL